MYHISDIGFVAHDSHLEYDMNCKGQNDIEKDIHVPELRSYKLLH